MTRVAAIDCGTNSIRLLIADVDVASSKLTDVVRLMETVRLGEGVDRTGEFSAAALERTFATCDRYADQIRTHGVSKVEFVATSASRDVSNRDEFANGVNSRLGFLQRDHRRTGSAVELRWGREKPSVARSAPNKR